MAPVFHAASAVPGYDWCLIQLGIPGIIHGFNVDTAHFLGNYPEHCSIEACALEGNPSIDELLQAHWTELVPKSRLQGGSRNYFSSSSRERWTHLRLNIYPDGGVARFRVHGEAAPDWNQWEPEELIDLAGIQNGGQVLICNRIRWRCFIFTRSVYWSRRNRSLNCICRFYLF